MLKLSPVVRDLHDSVLWIFSSPLCWLSPRLSPAICSSNGSALHSPRDFLGDIMYCMASVTLLQAVSDQRPKFCGVTSDLKPSVCCPCVVTIQAGPRPLSMSHVYMLKLIDLRLPPGYPIRDFLGTSNSSTWLDSATPSQFIFPVMPCQSPWIHFASCYPPQKCKQQL